MHGIVSSIFDYALRYYIGLLGAGMTMMTLPVLAAATTTTTSTTIPTTTEKKIDNKRGER